MEEKTPEKLKNLIEKIESLSVLEFAQLIKLLQEKFGIENISPQVSFQQAPSQPPPETPAEKDVFTIELKGIGDKKIEVIKLVRDITGKGLKEAKDLVDAAASAPQVIKENVKRQEAQEIKNKFEKIGAQIELK